jgi:NAD(P)H-nitrite reductase large subunit
MKRKNSIKKENKIIDYVIIGNSAAGLAAVESIRELDKTGKITVLCGEGHFNYSKPMITYFLTGSVDLNGISFRGREFYRDNNIDIRLNTRVESLNASRMSLSLKNGSSLKFRKLLVASGGNPIIPRIRTSSEGAVKDASFKVIDNTSYKKGLYKR